MSPTHSANQPRKKARQARAKRTVNAILEAAAHILKRDGLAGLTTNHIAREACVSVGSVYQYFPNKQSILLSVMTRQIETAMACRPAALDTKRTLRLHMQTAVRWHLDVRRDDPLLFQRLFEVQRDVLAHGERVAFEKLHESAVRDGLARYADEIKVGNLDTAALVTSQFLLATTQSATATHPELVADTEYESEVVNALVAYLTQPVRLST